MGFPRGHRDGSVGFALPRSPRTLNHQHGLALGQAASEDRAAAGIVAAVGENDHDLVDLWVLRWRQTMYSPSRNTLG